MEVTIDPNLSTALRQTDCVTNILQKIKVLLLRMTYAYMTSLCQLPNHLKFDFSVIFS